MRRLDAALVLTSRYRYQSGAKAPHSKEISLEANVKRILSVAALFGVLLLFWACYPASEVGYSNPQESTINQWLIEFRNSEAKLQLTMRYRRKGDTGFSYSNTGFGVTLDQLTGLQREQVLSTTGTNVRFQLKRDAGTFNFEGWFKDGNGSGHFTFSPNTAFASELARQGFGRPTDEQLLSLALGDTGFAFINELKAQGYDTSTVEQLIRMSNHGVRLEYLQGLKSLGYSVKTTELVVRMKDHGVGLNFIRELAGLGYTELAPEELIRTKDHGVSTTFVSELKALGYERLPLEDLVRMKDHGVSAAFIKELKELGYSNVGVEQLVRLKDHGVSASYIRRMKDKGYGDLSLDEYIRLRDRGEREE